MVIKNTVDPNSFLPQLSLAEAIESIRVDLGLRKVKMAKQLGISKSHYGNFINELEPVSIKRAGEWAKRLSYPEKLFVQYAVQGLLKRNNYNYRVALK